MLPRINVVLPDEQQQQRPLTTGTSSSKLHKSMSTGTAFTNLPVLHEPTTQEMQQYELMRIKLDRHYEVKNKNFFKNRDFTLIVLKLWSWEHYGVRAQVMQNAGRALLQDPEVIALIDGVALADGDLPGGNVYPKMS